MGTACLLALTLLLAPAAARAHGTAIAAPTPWSWNLSAWLLALLLAAALLYARGVWRLWSAAGWSRGIAGMSAAAFAAGWLVLVVALVSPLDTLGAHLFSAHMVQHELLMVLAAPLLVLGRPLAAWTWAFAPPGRRRIARAVQAHWLQACWAVLTDPVAAWALHALALWLWHVPGLFTAALEHEAVHVLQHASFLATALLFWWAALGGDARAPRGLGSAVGLLFTTMLHTAALGALLSLAPTPWYAPYIASTQALGMDPVDDQQLGGLVMWVPAGLAYLVAALALLGRLLTRQRA
jgi:putative membrane protein